MIEVRDLCFSYEPGKPVLSHVHLDVAPGERLVLLGRNGSGKSTLGRLLNGSLVPDSGELRVDGERDPGRLARLVGYVRQDPASQLVSELVEDEVAFGPRNLGLDEAEVDARVGEALHACGIAEARGRLASQLSGGQQQLLAVAGVVAMRPAYLVLDEAFSLLDPKARARLRAVLDGLQVRGLGIVEITHDEGAARTATKVLRLGDAPARPVVPAAPGPGRAPSAARGHVLELRDVSFSYADKPVLQGFSLKAQGLTLLLGPCGSGKSTAARLLAGVLEPDAGAALLDGAAVRAGQAALCFQRPCDQFVASTVLDDIAFAPLAQGRPREEALERARRAAGELGVGEELWERSPFELSGGEARRVALAGALAQDAPAYVFDEPTAGLDADGRALFRAFARRLLAAGACVVVVTHEEAEWLPLADAVVRLPQRRAEDGPNAAEDGPNAAGDGPNAAEVRQAPRTAARARRRAPAPGAYHPADTPIHALDARVKLLGLLAASAASFAAPAPWGLAAVAAVLAVLLYVSKTPAATVARGLAPASVVFAFSLAANALVLVGEPGIDVAGLARAVTAVARIALAVGFVLVVSATTLAPELARAAVRCLRPLAGLGLDVASASMTASVALRFVPFCIEEVERIRAAQLGRGACAGDGVRDRLASWAQVLVPLLVSLFLRADELADAMRDRCWGCDAGGADCLQ